MPTIASLPLEIIVLVLRCYMCDIQDAWIQHRLDEQGRQMPTYLPGMPLPPKNPSPPLIMFRLARVCRLWHDILTTHATFCAHVDFDQESVAARMLNGAGSHSLTVTHQLQNQDWDGNRGIKAGGRTDQFRDFISGNISRVHTLLIPYLPELFTPEFAAQATSLRRLYFTGTTPDPAEDAWFPDSFAPGAFPALVHLECNLPMWEPLTPLCVSSLRTLIIRRAFVPDVINGADEDDEAYLTDLDDLTSALARTPLLEHLDVELSDVFWDGQKVALPKLQVLKIRALTSVCAAFLRLATFPRDVKMQLECFSDSGFAEESNTVVLELLTEAIAASADRGARFAPVVSVALGSHNNYGGYQLRGWRRAVALKAAASDPEPDIELVLEKHASRADIRTLLEVLPLRAATSARIGYLLWCHGAPVFACAHAVCTLPTLQHLALELVYAPVAWELLARTPATRTFFHRVEFETKAALRGDRTQTDEMEKEWDHKFEFSEHISEFAAVCERRAACGLEPFVEMRHDREIPRSPFSDVGTQGSRGWFDGVRKPRYTEEPWTAECTPEVVL